ncbi:MAG: isoprenyl transferase [Bdellovibrionota bacterium]
MKDSALPRHIAIIMDGNGRWAEKRGLLRIQGHRQGARVLRSIVQTCGDLGVEILSLYAFSLENWSRPSAEVNLLMKLLKIYLKREREQLKKDNVRVMAIGDLERLPRFVQDELQASIEATRLNTGLKLQLAISYSGRDEILRAVKKMMLDPSIQADQINEADIEAHLDTKGQISPDLVIRTSGELRLSNFMIWQTAYSEFFFSDKLWPDFDKAELEAAIEEYQRRERRYGGIMSGYPGRINQ